MQVPITITKDMDLLHYKYLHLWLVTPIVFYPIGFPKPYKRINVSFHKRRNTTYTELCNKHEGQEMDVYQYQTHTPMS